ncbi:MAG: glutamine amidotransferase [Eubacteriales bacterium]|nr:glutamine amidotransferase [Eubacteriales bacterium]
MSKKELKLLHLYPDLLNLYGDFGNILAFLKRGKVHGIEISYHSLHLGEQKDLSSYDLFFMGGGQDREQEALFRDVLSRRSQFERLLQGGWPFLAICGAYQLLGKRFITAEGQCIEGLGLLDVDTRAGEKRLIGDSLYCADFLAERGPDAELLYGFENHSGRSYLGANATALAKCLYAYGNNGEDDYEGCRAGNFIATYSHGPFLPKNPAMTDYLLECALLRRYEKEVQLPYELSAAELAARKSAAALIERRKKER